jgi:GNAT superfamily N-acetyltransferase
MKYSGFLPEQDGLLTIGVEKLGEIHEEIRPLHAEHFGETEVLYLDTPFDPDYDRYRELEKTGGFVLITARWGTKLVGYIQYYVFRDLHTQGAYMAREDAMFITAEARGNKLAPRMLAYAEHAMAGLGCSFIGMTSKGPVGGPEIGPFLESKGYRPVAMFYGKKLEI